MKKRDIVFIVGFIACFLAAYQGMVFSPSFTMMFVVAGMGFCILGKILDMVQAGKRPGEGGEAGKKMIGWLSRVLYIFGMFWVFPAVIIYATGDDWMNGCMRLAAVGSVLLCGIWLGWMWKNKGIRAVVWGKAVELLVSLAAVLLAIFCGINSVALLPYGLGLLFMTIARQLEESENNCFGGAGVRRISAAIFILGLVLVAVFPVVPMLG